ncbi:DUF2065 family protein [Sphingomonas naphthae]|uniref:DUF2065 family protein n=1 Tax=Sphingomonas naphthae TaxID=1813468 RepID=A0ABY7TJY1_9SPHN|nr:DUF2065 family protein [Sphingomonas naphthae]WCT73266.1 DUF2065 family protein [Sphingomonas naphthae]
MIHTLDVLTLRLAEAIGLYLILAGLSGLRLPTRWQEIVADIAASAAVADLFGVACFVVGTAILIPHHHLSDPLAIIVTLCGWLALFEAALFFVFPDWISPILTAAARHTRPWAVVALVAGLLLFLAGLTGRAEAFI